VDDLASGTVGIDDLTVDLARVRVGARVEREGLEVSVHHPLVETLTPQDRERLARLVLGAALGEAVAMVGQVHPSEVPPIDGFDLAALRAFVDAQRR